MGDISDQAHHNILQQEGKKLMVYILVTYMTHTRYVTLIFQFLISTLVMILCQ